MLGIAPLVAMYLARASYSDIRSERAWEEVGRDESRDAARDRVGGDEDVAEVADEGRCA